MNETTNTTTTTTTPMRDAYNALMTKLRALNDDRKAAKKILVAKLTEAYAEYRKYCAENKAARKVAIDEFNALKAARKNAKKPAKKATKKPAKKAAKKVTKKASKKATKKVA